MHYIRDKTDPKEILTWPPEGRKRRGKRKMK
jgi:hypothetical protein